ncbi:MAG: hypothetical protein ABFE07_12805 [Armatimonadia bacterium]
MKNSLVCSLCLLLLLAPLQAQKPGPLVVIDLPTMGSLSGTAASLYTALRAEGFDVWWLRVHEPEQRGREAAAVLCSTGATVQRELNVQLSDYVQKGGGLVYLAGGSSEQLQENQSFLKPFNVKVEQIKRVGEVQLARHRISAGLEQTRFGAVPLRFTSDSLDVLATQGDESVALAGGMGTGRTVFMPAALGAGSNTNRAPEADKIKLLVQSLKWVAEKGAVTGPDIGPGSPATTVPAEANLSPRIIVDVPDVEPWKAIGSRLQDALLPVTLPVVMVTYQKGTDTLAQAAAARPSLIVLSGSRDFEEAEGPMLVEYVRSGGSLLVLGYGATNQIAKVTALNRLLGEFGIGFTYGRPAGKATLQQHPATAGLTALGKTPAGSAVWAVAQWPLATVDSRAIAAAHEVGRGRIIVFDSATLLPPTGKGAIDESQSFRDLLSGCVRWLTGR